MISLFDIALVIVGLVLLCLVICAVEAWVKDIVKGAKK